MVPAYDECNYLQSTGNAKFIGRQRIGGMLHRLRLVPLHAPKIPGTDHRWDLYLWRLYTVTTIQSCPYWNTKGCSYEGSKRPHRVSQMISVTRDKPSRTANTSTRNIEKYFNDTAETFPEGTPPQAQTSTNPTQPCALRATPLNHQRLTKSNTPVLIPVSLQNPITISSEGEQLTSKGSQPTSEGVHPPKQTTSETWYAQPRKKINISYT